MTTLLPLEVLDLHSPEVVAEWERAFYQGFAHVTGNRLIQTLWIWNHAERRLATRIPYADQLIYGWRDAAGTLATCLAINVTLAGFQSSAFGFQPDRSEGAPRACELLATFSLSDRSLSHVMQFRTTAFADLYQRGFRRAYLTTADKNYRIWVRCGAELLDEAIIDGERRRFLQFTFTPSGIPAGTSSPLAQH
jgi:hypothetical protein